ncbi:hypothetical protein GA0004736_3391 [Curtobacterium sp. 9128]|uniref:hypothetical protein n=1 Tax=Curtobacterium sp. 9128 TaxID=1793722 RepID=UPI0007D71030|nr:hypothetical protein [Curtobacterium sp. 9128]SBN64431.1 hypothetical protein GA0004736_3391 [Curtobacterium sp. 9128]
MPWFKVDDGFWSHPKTLQLSDGAQALWMRAGSWSMHHLTDGHIPAFALPLLRAKPRFVNELVAVSLWIPDEAAYRFHDWSRYQPTRQQIESDRDAAAERKRRSREKSRRDSEGTDGAGSPDAAPSPSHPVPSHPVPPSGLDMTQEPEVRPEGDVVELGTDIEIDAAVQERAARAGVRDLPRLHGLLERAVRPVGVLSPRAAVLLVEAITNRADGEVRDVDAYVVTAARNAGDVQGLYAAEDLRFVSEVDLGVNA